MGKKLLRQEKRNSSKMGGHWSFQKDGSVYFLIRKEVGR